MVSAVPTRHALQDVVTLGFVYVIIEFVHIDESSQTLYSANPDAEKQEEAGATSEKIPQTL
jgi:hypothetical protein